MIERSQQVKALGEKLNLEKQKAEMGLQDYGTTDCDPTTAEYAEYAEPASRLPAFAVNPLSPASIFVSPKIFCSVLGFGGCYKVNAL
jgi:hypothetical protein